MPDLAEPADESQWRALVEQGLKGAGWDRLTGRTADGLAIAPLYLEPDSASAHDEPGFPGAAPFIRGADALRTPARPWLIRQIHDHPDPVRANHDMLDDLAGGAASIELHIQQRPGARGVRIANVYDFDLALDGVVLDAAPLALDAGERGLQVAQWLAAKLRGAAGEGVAFNLDPLGVLMRAGAMVHADIAAAARFARHMHDAMPATAALRVDARPVHEAGGSEVQELAAALACGVFYMRALREAGLGAAAASNTLLFTLSLGPDVLLETAKLRALRLGWARVSEAFGAPAPARIHAQTGRRMLTRYDAHTNIIRISAAACAAALGGAQAITTLPFTDALGLPTSFARRVARNTQHVLIEEAHLGHVADPAGGAWFVEAMTQALAEKAWALFQEIEAAGGMVAGLQSGVLRKRIAETRAARQRAIAERRETITGVSDYPLLGAKFPAFEHYAATPETAHGVLAPLRWADPFEALRDQGERAATPLALFFATLGPAPDFAARARWSANLLASGGVHSLGAEDAHADLDALIDAFTQSGATAALIAGTDSAYAARAAEVAHALKAAGATWIVLAGAPGEQEETLRDAGINQFVSAGQDALAALRALHAALARA